MYFENNIYSPRKLNIKMDALMKTSFYLLFTFIKLTVIYARAGHPSTSTATLFYGDPNVIELHYNNLTSTVCELSTDPIY